MTSVTVGDLRFEVRLSNRRSTMQVTIDRGGELIVFAPADYDASVVRRFVREKRLWIYRKLAEKEALRSPVVMKEYVSGEGFPYLGRSYRLLLVDAQPEPVKLEAGRLKMPKSAAANGRAHMVDWYTAHGQWWLSERARRMGARVGVMPSGILVRDLGYRWGSCSRGETLNFHWKTVLLPPRMAEYVVAHELVHIRAAHHTPEFWQKLERAMPDFAARKEWLAVNGAAATAI
jgi:predicted metal-dependent hydrolase